MTTTRKTHTLATLSLLSAALMVAPATRGTAQGTLALGGQRASFGVHYLSGGFSPDPKQFPNIVSGGSLDVSRMGLGVGCAGFAAQTPDLIVNYANAGNFLRLYFQGQGDTALVINDGAGRWHCNDDFAGTNPQVDIRNPPAGQYEIWVTSYQAGQRIRGALMVTELARFGLQPAQAQAPAQPPSGNGGLAIGGNQANFGTHALVGGFTPDPRPFPNVVSGGDRDVSQMGLGADCRGFATRQPDLIVNYTNPQRFLRFFVQAQGDTALVINDAQGRWHCNDDTAGLNPQVDLQNPPAGQYDVWVASYQARENIRGTVYVTELMNRGAQP
ncbi:MAG: hypothetical protein AAF447_04915 [Myxococcota bacterium]